MKRFFLELSYDGTNYSGWQVQPNGTSIQELVQNALSISLRKETAVTGSGRTDAGVHALAQVAHFDAERLPSLRSLNGLLPPDIRIHSVGPAPKEFHARYSAQAKVYRYHLSLGPVQLPFRRLYAYHPRHPVNQELLATTTERLIGTHDYTSFVNEANGKDAVRTIERIDLIDWEKELVLEFEGSGFLYKMVRNLVGAMLDVAREKTTPDQLSEILEGRDRRLAGAAAPAHGLILTKVKYAPELFDV